MKEFARRRAEADFELVWARLSKASFDSLKESYRHAYMMGRGVYKEPEAQKEKDFSG